MDTVNSIDEGVADAILKMVMEEEGIKRSELRTEFILNYPGAYKEFDRIVEELITTKKLMEVEYTIMDEDFDHVRCFLIPSKSIINIRGAE